MYIFMGKYMTLMTHIKDYQNKWEGILHAWIGRFNIIKVLFLSKLIQCNCDENLIVFLFFGYLTT